jgi:ABC-type amino acid transport substrate-binding protein
MRTLIALCLFIFAAAPALAESAYDRVVRTGTLRCGYFSAYPFLAKDPNTGALEGIFYDYVEGVAAALSLKVAWTEELGLGDYPAALATGRIDAFCSGLWMTAERARGSDFTQPLFYMPLFLFTREGDTRFDADPGALNDGAYTIASLEGSATGTIAREHFPNAKLHEIPQIMSTAEMFVSLALGKADAVVYDFFTYSAYAAHNPGKIRRASDEAVKVYPIAMAVGAGEERLRRMLSNATAEMHLSGAVERILAKHERYPGAIYRVARPYVVPAP